VNVNGFIPPQNYDNSELVTTFVKFPAIAEIEESGDYEFARFSLGTWGRVYKGYDPEVYMCMLAPSRIRGRRAEQIVVTRRTWAHRWTNEG
jgi:hypothetical protein